MAENQIKPKNKTKAKLVLDVAIFVAFLVTMDPRSSGITVHEWLATSALAQTAAALWLVQTSTQKLKSAQFLMVATGSSTAPGKTAL